MYETMVLELPSMKKKFSYNPKRDLHVVDIASAGVDLRTAYVNGVVPAGAAGSDMEFNDVDDPSTLMNHPSDQFEAMRQSDYVKGAVSAGASSTQPAISGE